MTLVGSFPFSQRSSRLVELVETSGEFDRWRTAIEKEPTLDWEATEEWNLQPKWFKKWWVCDEKTTDTGQWCIPISSLQADPTCTSSPMEGAPAIPLHTKSSPTPGLQQPGSAKTALQDNFTQLFPWGETHLCPSHAEGIQAPNKHHSLQWGAGASGQKYAGTATLQQNCYPSRDLPKIILTESLNHGIV